MRNPFVTNGYVSAEYFCDRERETEQMVSLLTNGNNVALISQRRIGKTDLIRHCFAQDEIRNNYHTFLIDIYSTHSLCDFVSMFGQAVLQELRPKGRAVWEKFINVLTSVRSEITFDINGLPTWSIGLGRIINPTVTLDEIFRYLGEAEKPCLVAIDEFQQITKYADGESVEAVLRTYIQRCPNANFIFSGSQRHLIGEMFTSPARPFYQSVTLFNLNPIALERYQEFCQAHFAKAGKLLDDDVVPALYSRFKSITAYMQKVMNVLFRETREWEVCTASMIDSAVDDILNLSADTFDNLMYQLPEKQRNVLYAIAAEDEAVQVCSGAFARRHHLTSPSSVASAVKGLLEKDIITQRKDIYTLNDRFMQLWLVKTGKAK